jgi:hypothetical protein
LVIADETGVAGFEEEAERKRGRLFHDMERQDREISRCEERERTALN